MNKIMVMMLLAMPMFGQGDAEGTDISSAIPIYFGQTINDTMDAQLRPRQVYKVSLARGQKFAATMSLGSSQTPANLAMYFFGSNTRTVASIACNHGYNGQLSYADRSSTRSLVFQYEVPVSGDYYLVACTNGSTGVTYNLRFDAIGTPLLTTLPTQAGCVTGQVDYVEYSLRLIAMGLADEVSIGGTRLCPNCPVKAPLYGSMIAKLEEAMRANQPVEACHDSNGNIFKLRLTKF
ncbi:MAG: hypothetical protein JNK87_40880 [Bryobacterales bacterium]|nr:hypothetical protein [Bryobacterales bacterium]